MGACAPKAAEAIVVTVARTKKAFAPRLPIKENTEVQGERWAERLIGFLFGSLFQAGTLVPTVTFNTEAHLLHESCTDAIDRVALHLVTDFWEKEMPRERDHTPLIWRARPTLAFDREEDRASAGDPIEPHRRIRKVVEPLRFRVKAEGFYLWDVRKQTYKSRVRLFLDDRFHQVSWSVNVDAAANCQSVGQ